MYHRLKCGSTQENNQWRLPEGVVTWDRELKQLRLHNGKLPGGFAVETEQAVESTIPGSPVLTAGDATMGYYGEVSGQEFISGDTLTNLVAFTAGSDNKNSDAGWLKFAYQGKTLLMAKRSFRNNISPNMLMNAGIFIASDNTVVTMWGKRYLVRVINSRQGEGQLLRRVIEGPWATMSEAETNTENDAPGSRSWSAGEVSGGYYQLIHNMSWASLDAPRNDSTSIGVNRGWRPVLELIE